MVGVLAATLLMTLAGCGGSSDEPPAQDKAELIATIMQATPNPATPEQVAEAFALGSDFTDLQREMIAKDLVGSVVEWSLPVYEVAYTDGIYKVTSQPLPIHSATAVQLLRVVAFVQVQDDHDKALLESVQTNGAISLRGLVQAIKLRTIVVIEPAIVVKPHS